MDKETLIINSGLSARTMNLLLSHSAEFGLPQFFDKSNRSEFALKHLEGFDVRKMRRFKGIGKKTIKEVTSVCDNAGIKIIGRENEETDSNYKIITFNSQTKSGRALYDLAMLLQQQDKEVVISNIPQNLFS